MTFVSAIYTLSIVTLTNCFKTYCLGSLALFRFAQKSPLERIYWGERVFEERNLRFLSSKTRSPLKNFFARLSSVARNSA